MVKFKVTYNGYKIEFFDNQEEVDSFISSIIKEYQYLRPFVACDSEIIIIGKKARLLVYEYYTLYREVFIIECNE